LPLFLLLVCADKISAHHPHLFSTLLVGLVVLWLFAFVWMAATQWKGRRRLLKQLEAAGLGHTTKPAREYLSGWKFLGLPLIHYRMGGGVAAQNSGVKAWIAVGDLAIGGLFAFGGCAIAPISIGGIAVGLFSFGGCGVGLMTLGGFALGYYSFGAVGVGWFSFSACAIAWKAASGGVALAHDYALGGFAQAAQQNNDVARNFIFGQLFFRIVYSVLPYLFLMNLLWVLPLFKWWKIVKKQNIIESGAKSPS
jgi:hypothetical protein